VEQAIGVSGLFASSVRNRVEEPPSMEPGLVLAAGWQAKAPGESAGRKRLPHPKHWFFSTFCGAPP
jgi:hypothetical protein